MSRTDARSTALRRRPARTVPATITAVVLLALGVGLVWAAVQRLVQGSWPTFADQTGAWVAALSWGTVWVLVISIAVAVLGLILLVAAIKPGPPTAMVVDSGSLRRCRRREGQHRGGDDPAVRGQARHRSRRTGRRRRQRVLGRRRPQDHRRREDPVAAAGRDRAAGPRSRHRARCSRPVWRRCRPSSYELGPSPCERRPCHAHAARLTAVTRTAVRQER